MMALKRIELIKQAQLCSKGCEHCSTPFFLIKAFKAVWKIHLEERSNGRFTEETLIKKFEEEMAK